MPEPVTTSLSTWEAIKGVLIALPKILEMFQNVTRAVQQQGYDSWIKQVDEATRIGMEAQKTGISLEQAKELARKYSSATGGARPQPR